MDVFARFNMLLIACTGKPDEIQYILFSQKSQCCKRNGKCAAYSDQVIYALGWFAKHSRS